MRAIQAVIKPDSEKLNGPLWYSGKGIQRNHSYSWPININHILEVFKECKVKKLTLIITGSLEIVQRWYHDIQI